MHTLKEGEVVVKKMKFAQLLHLMPVGELIVDHRVKFIAAHVSSGPGWIQDWVKGGAPKYFVHFCQGSVAVIQSEP